MPLHLIKLCVGADSIGDLEEWIGERLAEMRRAGEPPEQRHTTRMQPKRVEELLDGGSLYWVIRGQLSARQALLGIRPFKDADGIGRCHLVLEPAVVPVQPRPCRPFQGWRYLAMSRRRPISAAWAAPSPRCRSRCGGSSANWVSYRRAGRGLGTRPVREVWPVGPLVIAGRLSTGDPDFEAFANWRLTGRRERAYKTPIDGGAAGTEAAGAAVFCFL